MVAAWIGTSYTAIVGWGETLSINATQSQSGEYLVHGQIVVCNPEISLEKIDIQGENIYIIIH